MDTDWAPQAFHSMKVGILSDLDAPSNDGSLNLWRTTGTQQPLGIGAGYPHDFGAPEATPLQAFKGRPSETPINTGSWAIQA